MAKKNIIKQSIRIVLTFSDLSSLQREQLEHNKSKFLEDCVFFRASSINVAGNRQARLIHGNNNLTYRSALTAMMRAKYLDVIKYKDLRDK